jgi:hypothetical protein
MDVDPLNAGDREPSETISAITTSASVSLKS